MDSDVQNKPSGLPEMAFRIGSGTLAVLGVIAFPIVLGAMLDRRVGGFVGMIGGVLIGMTFGLVVLLRLAQKWTPAARRSKNEIPYEDATELGDDDDEPSER